MPNLDFKAILKADLPNDGNFTTGTLYFTDDGQLKLGVTGGHSISYNGFEVVSSLPTSSISVNKIYILNTNWQANIYDGTQWHTLSGSGGGFIPVSSLPTFNIDTNKLYLLDTDFSINYYNGTTWQKYGTTNITEIDDVPIDSSTRVDNTFLGYNQSDGKYEHRKITVSGIVGSTGEIIQPSGTPITLASQQETIISHPQITNDKLMINVQEQYMGETKNDTHVDFSDSSKYYQQDSTTGTIINNNAKLIIDDKYTKLLMHMNDNFNDEYNHNIIINGASINNTTYKFGNGSGYFNGNSIKIINNILLNLNSIWTIDFWINPTALTTGTGNQTGNLIGFTGFSNDDYSRALISFAKQTKQIAISNMSSSINSTITLQLNTWYHIEVCSDSKNIYLYINGNLDISITNNFTYTDVGNIVVGMTAGSYTYYYYGFIDELRISQGIMRHSSDFVTPIYQYGYNTKPSYVATTGQSNFSLPTISVINNLTIPVTTPTNTSVKILFSVDNQTNWLYHDSNGLHKFTSDLTQDWSTNSNSNTDLQTYFSNLSLSQLTSDLSSLGIIPVTLDFAFQLKTSDITVTPTVSPITLNYTTLSHMEMASYGSYDETTVKFGIKRIDNSNLAIKNLTSQSRTVLVNMITSSTNNSENVYENFNL